MNDNFNHVQAQCRKPFCDGVTEGTFFLSWLLFFFASSIGTTIAGAVVGAVIGFVLGAIGASANAIMVICGMIGFVLGAALSYLLFRIIVKKMIIDKILVSKARED